MEAQYALCCGDFDSEHTQGGAAGNATRVEEVQMAMSDCEKCWDTPCTCGWDYRNWSRERRIKQVSIVLGVSEEALRVIDVPVMHPGVG